MAVSPEQIIAEAMTLPPEQREQIADRLWASVDADQNASLGEEWLTEIKRRIQEIDDGTETVPAEEVFARVCAELSRCHHRP